MNLRIFSGLVLTLFGALFTLNTAYAQTGSSRETANGLPISDERLMLQTPNDIIRSIACINPDVALMLAGINSMSRQVSVSLPTVGMGTTGKKVTCDAVLDNLKRNGDDVHVWDSAPAVGLNKDDYGKVSWILSKDSAAKAKLVLVYEIFDVNNNSIAKPYPDVTLELKWVADASTGYWSSTKRIN